MIFFYESDTDETIWRHSESITLAIHHRLQIRGLSTHWTALVPQGRAPWTMDIHLKKNAIWFFTSTTLSNWSWSHSGVVGHHAVQTQGVIVQSPVWSEIGWTDGLDREKCFASNLCCTVRSPWPSVPRRKSSPPSWLDVRQRLRVTWLQESGQTWFSRMIYHSPLHCQSECPSRTLPQPLDHPPAV